LEAKVKRKFGYFLIAVVLIAIGYLAGTVLFRSEAERVVLYESVPQETETRVIPASFAPQTSTDVPGLNSLNEAFVNIAEIATPSVVTIMATKVFKGPDIPEFANDEFFWRFFGLPREPEKRKSLALGSGVIVDAKGYILTNNHVVESTEKIEVTLSDKRKFKAEIIGTDPRTDLAVVKINADNLKPAVLGDSDALRVGEWVLAIGSPFSENLAHTVTAGIVSAKGRSNIIGGENKYEFFIQTDAAINPGNSGGALVNIRGELVGINAAIATDGLHTGNLGIGFAIPINLSKKIMKDIIEKGRVIRAWLGVRIQPVDDPTAKAMQLDSRDGALVSEVVKDSPADKAGVKVGDVILEFDGTRVKDPSHLQTLVANTEVDSRVNLLLIRSRKEETVEVKLAEYSEEGQSVASLPETAKSELGISVQELTPELAERFGYGSDEKGVVVTEIDPESEAAKILRTGDIIQRIGDKDIVTVSDFRKATDKTSGEYILVLIKRKDATFFVTLELPQ
jgi:serine protease Do